MSAEEFEEMVERTIDNRLQVWVTQLRDALLFSPEEENVELKPKFVASLRRSLKKVRPGKEVDLKTFSSQIRR